MALGALIGAGLSALGRNKANKDAAAGQTKLANDLIQNSKDTAQATEDKRLDLISQLFRGSFLDGIAPGFNGFGLDDVFPKHEPFNPVVINDTLKAAVDALQKITIPGAVEGARTLARATTDQDVERAETLLPGFSDKISTVADTTASLLRGEIPDDVLDAISTGAAEKTARNRTPGTGENVFLKDLGTTSLDLQSLGTQRLIQTLGSLNRDVNPVGRNASPTQVAGAFTGISAPNRLGTDVQQAQLDQQSRQSGEFLRVLPGKTFFESEFLLQPAVAGINAGNPVEIPSVSGDNPLTFLGQAFSQGARLPKATPSAGGSTATGGFGNFLNGLFN